jgi:hypothetical protein
MEIAMTMVYAMQAATDDITKGWIYDVDRGISPEDAQEHCVRHEAWQDVRLSMKGKTTARKLMICLNWFEGTAYGASQVDERIRRMQVTNYLGALRRGGQLDDNNMIRKYI